MLRRHALLALFAGTLAAVLPGIAQAQPADVFISEYIEGTSNNKAIEIYNGTGAAINLATGSYVLQQYFNGSASPGLSISLTGTVAAGDVYVVAQASANATILAQADQTNGSGFFNGDDAIVLRKGGAAGPIVDVIGQVGFDPGSEWGTGLASTADNTLRRKATVCQGDTNPSDAFTPSVEWDGFATDTFGGLGSHTANCSGLSITDVALNEGDSGTTTFSFTVNLSSPAPVGGVTFDIATQDNSATLGDNDYQNKSLTGQSIPFNQQTYTFDVLVEGDTNVEPNEAFFVNVTNVVGATVSDAQGVGTIQNDDFALTPIHDIQGPGASSPLSGSVTTTGIVTGVKSNGFFIQEPDASVDADPATSEGILVFTGGAPPAAAAVGNLVQVTGTISEFVPSQDPLQPPLTELTSPTVVQLSTGNPLPAAIPLTATFPDPAGVHDQLERLEGMRVSVASLTVTGPTLGSLAESTATSSSTGVFYGVVTGVPRPFREAGIQAPDPAPSGGGTIPPIPRFDSNPERIRVDSDGLVGGPLIDVGTGAAVTGLIGPLDYSFRTYTILPDPGAPAPGVAGGPTATAVTAPTGQEFTMATFNMQRFYDTVDDAGVSDVALTAAAFDKRLAKASLGVRNNLGMPDILGVVEMENLTTLQALASRISADAIAASQPDPQYAAYLVEGNDIGGIDVGFLVKTAPVAVATPRVEVVTVQQELAGTLFVNPDASTELLHDRPPLRLEAIVHHPNGASFPVTVIVNHLRSLNSVNSEAAGSNGWPTSGARVRAKRQEQAEDLANLVQARQTADPTEHIILVGDFNAFEVNDGLVDSMDVIAGTPAPDNETAVPGDGVDLVSPDLDNLFDTPPAAERYGYVFDGNAQNLDHVLVNAPLIADTVARRIEHPRIDADFPDTARNDGTTPVRLSDHDPVVGFFQVAAFATADLSVDKVEGADPVAAGANLAYTITVTNGGPDPAGNVSWSDTLPTGTTFVSLTEPGGWTCTTPAAGSGGTVDCSIASLAVGSAAFTLTVTVDAGAAPDTVLSNTVTVTSDTDSAADTETTTVAASADLQVVKNDAFDPIPPGGTQTYEILLTNAGPNDATSVTLTDNLPAGTTFLSLSTSPGWTCTAPAVGSGGTVDCSIGSLAASDIATFTLEVLFDAGLSDGTVVTNTATVSSETLEASPGNESSSANTTVMAAAVGADLSIAKTGSPDPVMPGSDLTYTITVFNQGPSPAVTVTFDDLLPDGTTFQSLSSPGGWTCTTPAVGATGIVSCSVPTLAPGSAVFTLVVQVDASVPAGTLIANTVVVFSPTPDPNPENQNAAAFNTVGSAGDVLSLAITDNPDPVTAGFDVTYTITVSSLLFDAPDATLTAPVPAGTTFQAFSAPPGWTCATPAVGAAGTVSCTSPVLPFGGTSFALTVRVPASASAGSTITDTASIGVDPGGNPATATDSETTTVAAATVVTATKAVSGQFQPNGSIVYTIVLANAGPGNQGDNPGDELTDVLPSSLILVSASATSGTAVATVATNTVAWNGAIPAGGSVTITIQATIRPDVAFGTPIANQATFAFDATGDGTNESSGVSDDPSTGAAGDATVILLGLDVLEIPALDTVGLALLAALLALGGFLVLRRVL